MLTVKNISLSYGKRVLFDSINLSFTKGNCYGIIGANGAGKSTFLKILSGELEPNKGEVELTNGQRIGVLSQNHFAFNDYTLIETVMMGYQKLWHLFKERETIYAKEDFTEEEGLRVADLEAEFGEIGGYSAENDASNVLNSLGVPESAHLSLMKDVSGNIKVKTLLAQALFGNPDVLLLDEPTNDLEKEAIIWLEDFLADYGHIVLVVSHDRHFLDNVCTHIVDIDRHKASIYTGNYSFWYQSSQLIARQLADKNKKVEEKRKELTDFIARFSANASKSKQATSRKKALEKLVVEEIRPSNRKYPGIMFKPEREVGGQILKVEKLAKKVEQEYLFKDISFTVEKNQKIAILSKNQLAVSYFFDIITGKVVADEGQYEWGTTIIPAYLPLENTSYFTNKLDLLEWLRQFVPDYVKNVDEPFLRGFLGRMLFSGSDILKTVDVLSGGEKMRCMISRMMMQNPNVIILDQPTNHLDLESITSFNNAVIDFNGIVFLSTHDHEFMQTSVNRIIELTPHGMIDRLATYDTYLADESVKTLQQQLYRGG